MIKEEKLYNKTFYEDNHNTALPSARKVVPLVIDLVQPESVIDIGCGIGAWLSVFEENSINDIIGVDGEYIDKNKLLISEQNFITYDLKQKFNIDKKFDLAVSLEVAEHLPETNAKLFVKTLTNLAPIVLFSAAIPFQGGTNHINEQWPTYWASLFIEEGFVAVDYLRKQIWNDADISWWYSQNILFFVKEKTLSKYPLLKEEYENNKFPQLSLVHPKLWFTKKPKRELIKDYLTDFWKK